MKKNNERGAVVIEATISLAFFMFAMLTIYCIYHSCLAQARIGAALNSTAKEISQYSYLYDLTGLNDKQSEIHAGSGAAESTLSVNLGEVNGFFDALEGLGNSAAAIAGNSGEAESFVYYLLNEGIDGVKGAIMGELSRNMMKKHFGSDPDGYLKGLGVEGGLGGLSFVKSRIFQDGEQDDILINCRYKIKVFDFLDIDFTFNIEQCAVTKAWTAG